MLFYITPEDMKDVDVKEIIDVYLRRKTLNVKTDWGAVFIATYKNLDDAMVQYYIFLGLDRSRVKEMTA